MGLRGGVHEIIPVFVILAVTVALTFAVVSYMTTGWGHLSWRNTEILRIGVDNGVVRCSDGTVILYVQAHNKGLHDIVIYKVEFIGYGSYSVVGVRAGFGDSPLEPGCEPPPLSVVAGEGLVVRHGFQGWIYFEVPSTIAAGLDVDTVDVKLYTMYGTLFIAHVPVRLG